MRPIQSLSFTLGVVLASICPVAIRAVEMVPGVFDVTPVSATNPVVAEVKDCGIRITSAELLAYTQSELQPQAGLLAGSEKHAALDGLIDEYFLVRWAVQQKADQNPRFQKTMDETRKMLLAEALRADAIVAKSTNAADYPRLEQALRDQLFDKAQIKVFSDAYDELKTAVLRPAGGTNHLTLAAVPDQDRPLAHCNGLTVTIGDVLHAYLNRRPSHRPDLQKNDGLGELLKEILETPLMVDEARARGLEDSSFLREKLALNRAALLRFYAQDRVANQAAALMKAPDLHVQLKRWFEAHLKDRYTYKDETGHDKVYAFVTEQERIADDYFEHLRETVRAETVKSLRAGHPVLVDEKQLDQLVLAVPSAPPAAELASSVIAWDSDVKEHTVVLGETNALFTFHLANISSNDVTIYEVHPSCECTTVRLPELPWRLAPGDKGELVATVDLRGKTNSYDRGIYLDSSGGGKTLMLKIKVPRPLPAPSNETSVSRR